MSTHANTPKPQTIIRREDYRLPVNTYDRTVTLMTTLLIMAGLVVLGLLIIFTARRFVTDVTLPQVSLEASSPKVNQGFEEDAQPAGLEDAPDLEKPKLSQTLHAVVRAVARDQSIHADVALNRDAPATRGKAPGERRTFGPEVEGDKERVPRWERWKVRFEPKDIAVYAAWLDYYKIRVAVLDRQNNKVHLAYNFQDGLQMETAPPEQYPYPAWNLLMPVDAPLPEMTLRLADRAGISGRGSIVRLLVPFDVERLLRSIESEYSPGRDIDEVRETIFRVRTDGDGFRFEVMEQHYF